MPNLSPDAPAPAAVPAWRAPHPEPIAEPRAWKWLAGGALLLVAWAAYMYSTQFANGLAAAEGANLGPDTDFRVSITNAPGAGAYPISSFTWLLVHKTMSDAARAAQIKAFCTWMIGSDAQAMASGLQYAPLPAPVVALVKARLAAEVGAHHALRLYRVLAARTLGAILALGLPAVVWGSPA